MEWRTIRPSRRSAGHRSCSARLGRNHSARGPRHRRHRGVALAWTVLTLMVMILMVGLSIDWGKVTINVNELQNAADAAALAGAQWVKIDMDTARDRAQQLGLSNDTEKLPVQLDRNVENVTLGDVVLGKYDKDLMTFTPTLDKPNAVQIHARRTEESHGAVAMLFGPLAAKYTADIERTATAFCTGVTGAGLIVLAANPTEYTQSGGKPALTFGGDVTVDVENGIIQVNSTADAVKFDGNKLSVVCDGMRVGARGDENIVFNGIAEEQLPFDIVHPSPYVPDPLASLQRPIATYPPDASTWPDKAPSNKQYKITAGTVTIQPGYYSQGINITGGNVTFLPGIYVLGGPGENQPGFQITGGNVIAHGVMFYLAAGQLNFTGAGTIDMTPIGDPDVDDSEYPAGQASYVHDYDDVMIFQARDDPPNLNEATATINGTSNFDIGGTLYFRKNHLNLNGTAGNTFRPGDQLICNTVNLGGSGTLEIDYKGKELIIGYLSALVHVVE